MRTENKIRVSTRDIRATANGLYLARRAFAVNPAQAFVQDLLDRYGSRFEPRMHLNVVFRRDRSQEAGMSQTFHRATIYLSPRLSLTLLTQATASQLHPKLQPAVQGKRIEASPHPSRSSGPAVQQQDRRRPSIAPSAPAPARQAAPSVHMVPQAGHPEALPVIDSVKRVTRLPQTTVQEEPQIVRRRLAQPALRSHGDMMPIDDGEAAPVDLNRLTDHVIKAIDRRIVAERERLGRL